MWTVYSASMGSVGGAFGGGIVVGGASAYSKVRLSGSCDCMVVVREGEYYCSIQKDYSMLLVPRPQYWSRVADTQILLLFSNRSAEIASHSIRFPAPYQLRGVISYPI